jgi:hypothetical protein
VQAATSAAHLENLAAQNAELKIRDRSSTPEILTPPSAELAAAKWALESARDHILTSAGRYPASQASRRADIRRHVRDPGVERTQMARARFMKDEVACAWSRLPLS